MEFFGNRANPGSDARPTSPDEDTCAWCVQLREADTAARPASAGKGKRSLAPWMVPLGLNPHPAQVDR